MNGSISVCVLIIVSSCNFYFFQSLMITEGKSVSIAQVHLSVIGIVYMGKAHGYAASAGCHGIMDQDQVSVIVIYMNISRSSHILAVIAPVSLQT